MKQALQKRPLHITAIALSSAAAVALLVGMGPATSATPQPATEAGQQPWAGYADLVERVMPAVVNVTTTRQAKPAFISDTPRQGTPDRFGFQQFGKEMPGGEWFERFFENTPRGFQEMPEPGPQMGAGSGFIIDDNGLIVTNHHVIANAESIEVTLSDGTEHTAELVGQDPETDLALLQVEADGPLPKVTFGDSDKLRVGDPVVAIGNPFGLGGTVTAGIISAQSRDIGAGRFDDFLQIDAPINRGNSGGPAFNLNGEVIGINTSITSPTGGNVGIGFAIPADLAEQVIVDLLDDGKVDRGWLGVQIQTVDPDLAGALGLEAPEGALVAQVLPDSPAEAAGLVQQDVILKLGDMDIDELRALTKAVANTEPGTDTELTVWRDGKMVTVDVTIEQTADDEQVMAMADDQQIDEDAPRMGVALASLTDDLQQSMNLPAETAGVVIMDVEPGSTAAEKGLKRGDVIIEAGSHKVSEPAMVAEAVADAAEEGKGSLLLLLQRDGETRYVAVPLMNA